MPKTFACVLLLAVAVSSLLAKDNVFQTVSWPESGQTVLRFSFSKFKDVGGMGKEHTYLTDTIAENVSDKTIGNANFSLYVFDKSNARIGEGYINLANVGPGQTVKFQITLSASGNPVSVAVFRECTPLSVDHR